MPASLYIITEEESKAALLSGVHTGYKYEPIRSTAQHMCAALHRVLPGLPAWLLAQA